EIARRFSASIQMSRLVETHVDSRGALDRLARRNVIHAGFRNWTDRFETNSTGSFEWNPPIHELYRLAHHIERHIVEHNDVRFRGNGFMHLLHPITFHLDLDQPRHPRPRSLDSLADATRNR